jgi:outer membrane cobalamin receptor
MRHVVRVLVVLAVSAFPGARAVRAQEPVELSDLEVRATPILRELRLGSFADKVAVVGREQIDLMNASDLSAALRRIPGVTVSRYNMVGAYGGADGGAIFIRGHGAGRPGADITTALDGIPRFVGIWTHPLLDTMSLDLAGEVEVYKSPQPVLFGNMAFGAVNVVPAAPERDGVHGRLRSVFGEHETWTEQGAATYRDDALDLFFSAGHRESDGHRDGAGGETDSINGRVGLRLSDAWSASFLFTHTDSMAEDPGPVGAARPGRLERYLTDTEFYLLKLSHATARARGEIKFYYEDGEARWEQWDADRSQPFDHIPEWDNYGVRLREILTVAERTDLTAGIDLDWYGGKTEDRYRDAPALSSKNDRETFRNTSPYVALQTTFGDDLAVTPSAGVRFNDSQDFDDAWGAQAGLRVDAGENTFYANAADAYNYPGVYAAFLYGNTGGGDGWKDLEPERIQHVEAGWTRRFGDRARLDLSVFHDEVTDALRLAAPPPRYSNIGEYTSRGAEVTGMLSPCERIDLYAGATWNDPDRDDVPNLPEWTASAGLHARPIERLSVHIDMNYIDEYLALNPRLRAPPASIDESLVFHARAGWTLTGPDDAASAEIFVLAENFTDEAYEYRPGYPMPGATWSIGLDLEF